MVKHGQTWSNMVKMVKHGLQTWKNGYTWSLDMVKHGQRNLINMLKHGEIWISMTNMFFKCS